jgi:hypothetical protein
VKPPLSSCSDAICADNECELSASDPSKIQISAPAFYIIIIFMKEGFQLLEVMLPVIFGDMAAWAPRVECRAHDLSLYLSRFLPPSSHRDRASSDEPEDENTGSCPTSKLMLLL